MCGFSYHLKRPYPSYPDLELALYTPDIVKLDAFPPASPGRFPPEQQQFLGHTDSVAVGEIVALDVGPEACKGNTADDGLVGFSSAMAPVIVVIETTKVVSALIDLIAMRRITLR